MAITFNGSDVQNITYNGNAVQRVTYNGTEVWRRAQAQPSEFVFTFEEPTTQSICLKQSAANAVTVDWGDGSATESPADLSAQLSHSFEAGTYTITISCKSGETWIPGYDDNTALGLTGSYSVAKTNLISATIGDAVTTIGQHAFTRNTAVNTVVLSDSVTVIKDSGFVNCSGMTDLHLGSGLTEFRNFAFQGCTSLQNIYLKDIQAFCDIDNTANQPANAEPFWAGAGTKIKNLYLNGVLQTSLVVPSTVQVVRSARLSKLGSVKNLEVAATELQVSAFRFATGLEKVWIRDSVETIGGTSETNGPFANCSSSMQIYCECAEADKPSGWSDYWNYIGSGSAITPIWGQTTSPF